ncbi:hypothetical protein HALLA_04055 (plasmid) [Halostagnicola larsenii XH-48]|uniref:Uncharacterized protein n=1 Tax=Halostagnicola larsenii XH-48 TaxID=797299 RepID=W0JWZ8_9EURY|nr:hypothetical protein HALLA_04055 [Halostagnicola larsenii XH-48]
MGDDFGDTRALIRREHNSGTRIAVAEKPVIRDTGFGYVKSSTGVIGGTAATLSTDSIGMVVR